MEAAAETGAEAVVKAAAETGAAAVVEAADWAKGPAFFSLDLYVYHFVIDT